jgi:hypothetical protein
VEKWALDNRKCMTFWTANRERFNDCARCITTCPWNLPSTWWARAITWGIPHSRLWRRALVLVDDLVRGKKPNPLRSWLYYRTPGPRQGWTIPPVIE